MLSSHPEQSQMPKLLWTSSPRRKNCHLALLGLVLYLFGLLTELVSHCYLVTEPASIINIANNSQNIQLTSSNSCIASYCAEINICGLLASKLLLS